MPRKKKTMGKGAVVSVRIDRLHPSELIRAKWPNPVRHFSIGDLVVLRQEIKKISKKDQMAIIMTHNDFRADGESIELYAHSRFCTIIREGDPDLFFTIAPSAENSEAEAQELVPTKILGMMDGRVLGPDDIEIARNLVEIDDDNEPAPENVPQEGQGDHVNIFGEWGGHDGLCYRRATNARNQNPTLNFPRGVKPTRLQLFELLFPRTFVQEIILPMINKEVKFGGPVEYWEFLRFVGLWLLLATIQGPSRTDFWSTDRPSRFYGAPFRICSIVVSVS
jgi:hypothetical protein